MLQVTDQLFRVSAMSLPATGGRGAAAALVGRHGSAAAGRGGSGQQLGLRSLA
jgi:hypothetical protein